jgi:hypothetical protein
MKAGSASAGSGHVNRHLYLLGLDGSLGRGIDKE